MPKHCIAIAAFSCFSFLNSFAYISSFFVSGSAKLLLRLFSHVCGSHKFVSVMMSVVWPNFGHSLWLSLGSSSFTCQCVSVLDLMTISKPLILPWPINCICWLLFLKCLGVTNSSRGSAMILVIEDASWVTRLEVQVLENFHSALICETWRLLFLTPSFQDRIYWMFWTCMVLYMMSSA